MRRTAAILFAFAVMATGCGESTADGDGGSGGEAGMAGSGGSAGSGGTSGAGGDGGNGGTPVPDSGGFIDIDLWDFGAVIVTDLPINGGGNTFYVGTDRGGEAGVPAGARYSKVGVTFGFGCGVLDSTGAIECWGNDFEPKFWQTPPEGSFGDVVVSGHDDNGMVCGMRSDRTVVCAHETNFGQSWRSPRALPAQTLSAFQEQAVQLTAEGADFFGYSTVTGDYENVASGVNWTELVLGRHAWGITAEKEIIPFGWNPAHVNFPYVEDTVGSEGFDHSLAATVNFTGCALDTRNLATCASTRGDPFEQEDAFKDAITDRPFEKLLSDRDGLLCGLGFDEVLYCFGSSAHRYHGKTVRDLAIEAGVLAP